MKFFAVIAAVAAAVASVNAVDCDVLKIAPVVTGADGTACTTKSGFTFLKAVKPTADILAKVCPVAECQSVLKQVSALGLGDCTVAILVPPLQLETDLIKAFTTGCAGLSTTGGSGSGNSSATVTTPAPAATTAAPAASSNSTGSSTSNSSASTTPTPSPTSAASSVVVASGAVVLAVAASFL